VEKEDRRGLQDRAGLSREKLLENKIRWLRLSFRAGAILDFLAAIQMLFPAVFAATNGLGDFHPGREYFYAMGMGALLMLGWTVLLLWADRKPLERRGILPITVFPVIAGMILNEGHAVWVSGFLSIGSVIPIWILQMVLSVVFLVSYFRAGKSG
jgi:hypothetical protein